MENLSYTELVAYLKAAGCTWIHHSNYWEGAGWKVDERGRGIFLIHFHIDYPGTGEHYPQDHPYFPGGEIHKTNYETGFTATTGMETFPDYTPTRSTVSGYCLPIDEALDYWAEHTAAFYARENLIQPLT